MRRIPACLFVIVALALLAPAAAFASTSATHSAGAWAAARHNLNLPASAHSRSTPAFSDGRIYVRSAKEGVCFDPSGK